MGKAVKPLQPFQAAVKVVQAVVVSAGNDVSDEQFCQVYCRLVAEDVSIFGNVPPLVVPRLLQPAQVNWKNVPDDVIKAGNSVKPEQFLQVLPKVVPEDVLIAGKMLKLEQPNHALLKFVPDCVLISGKVVKPEHPDQADWKLVTFCVWLPTAAKDVNELQLTKAF